MRYSGRLYVKILLIFLAGVLVASINANARTALFLSSDLNGTWYAYGQEFGATYDQSGMGYGTLQIGSSGLSLSGTYTALGGSSRSITGGSISINSYGVLSGTIRSSTGATLTIYHGKMDSDKSSLMYMGITGGGHAEIGWLVKAGGTFSGSDLNGKWHVYGQEFGPTYGQSGMGYGTLQIGTSGQSLSGTYTALGGSSRSITGGSVYINSSGILGGTIQSSTGATLAIYHGKMDAKKSSLLYMGIASDGSAEIGWLVKAGGTFSGSDLDGKWYAYGQEFGATYDQSGMGYGTLQVGSSGLALSGTYTALGGSSRSITGGSVNLVSTGILSGTIRSSTGTTLTIYHGKMASDKSSLLYMGITSGGSAEIGWLYSNNLPAGGDGSFILNTVPAIAAIAARYPTIPEDYWSYEGWEFKYNDEHPEWEYYEGSCLGMWSPWKAVDEQWNTRSCLHNGGNYHYEPTITETYIKPSGVTSAKWRYKFDIQTHPDSSCVDHDIYARCWTGSTWKIMHHESRDGLRDITVDIPSQCIHSAVSIQVEQRLSYCNGYSYSDYMMYYEGQLYWIR